MIRTPSNPAAQQPGGATVLISRPLALAGSPPVAADYRLAGPAGLAVGRQAQLDVTPLGTVDSDTVSFSADGGTVAPTSLDWTASSAPQSVVYTAPATPGTYHVTATSADGGTVAGSPLAIVVSAASSRPTKRWFSGLSRHHR